MTTIYAYAWGVGEVLPPPAGGKLIGYTDEMRVSQWKRVTMLLAMVSNSTNCAHALLKLCSWCVCVCARICVAPSVRA